MASAKTQSSPSTHSALCTDTFSECVERHRAAEDNPYVAAARARIGCDDEHEIDEITVVSESDDGVWVMSWVWVSKDDIDEEEDEFDSSTTQA